jgi:formylglycine-generating enzyme required for sulfatase activity
MEAMLQIPGGEFHMGSTRFYPEEAPVHVVSVEPFRLDRHPVTNTAFAEFVDATDYVTVAERPLDPDDFPGAPPELLRPGGLVFHPTAGPVPLHDVSRWWSYVPGASWRTPHGPGSDVDALADHPVVQVAYEDAEAFAAWRGVRLPTEAEWERAARGGLDGADYTWGDEEVPEGEQRANTWQGEFPWQNLMLDGFASTSPVGSFPPNGYGWWRGGHHPEATHACCGPSVDRGPEPMPGERHASRVIKGGSHLCAPNYCLRFRPAARQPQSADTSTCHIGFRCAADDDG